MWVAGGRACVAESYRVAGAESGRAPGGGDLKKLTGEVSLFRDDALQLCPPCSRRCRPYSRSKHLCDFDEVDQFGPHPTHFSHVANHKAPCRLEHDMYNIDRVQDGTAVRYGLLKIPSEWMQRGTEGEQREKTGGRERKAEPIYGGGAEIHTCPMVEAAHTHTRRHRMTHRPHSRKP